MCRINFTRLGSGPGGSVDGDGVQNGSFLHPIIVIIAPSGDIITPRRWGAHGKDTNAVAVGSGS